MKKMKKIFALLIAMVMVLGMSTMAFAAPVEGTDGKITVNQAYKGETYTVYTIFEGKMDGDDIYYSLPEGKTLTAPATDWFTVDAAGNVLAKLDADGNEVVKSVIATDEFKNWVQGFATTEVTHKVADSNTVEFTGLGYGYYYVKSTVNNGAVVMVDSANKEATITDKNYTEPTIPEDGKAKKVVSVKDEVSGTTRTINDDAATAKIGDTLAYSIDFTATNYYKAEGAANDAAPTLITTYTVTDTPTGMTIDPDSIKVTVTDADGAHVVTAFGEGTTKAANGFNIVIPWVDNENQSLYKNGAAVKVEYNATLTAETGSNEATIKYNDVTLDEPDTEVTTDQFDLVKDNNQKQLLQNAVFSLKSGEGIVKVKETETAGVFVVDPTNGSDSFTVATGKVTIKGLDPEVAYTVDETQAPEGYNELADTSNPNVTIKNLEAKAATLSADGKSYVSGGVEVVNEAGAELPSTGGIGTTIFYIIGAILVVGAGVVLVTRRRMNVQ